MAQIGILLTMGPFQFENWETAVNIAEAALDKGHQVRIFHYLDGILNPNKNQTFPDLEEMPKDRFAKLVAKGVKPIACGICVNARGLENGKDYLPGVKIGGLPDLADIVGEVDRLIAL